MSSDRLTIAELDELERRHMEAWSTGNMGVGLRHNEILALIAAARQDIEAQERKETDDEGSGGVDSAGVRDSVVGLSTRLSPLESLKDRLGVMADASETDAEDAIMREALARIEELEELRGTENVLAEDHMRNAQAKIEALEKELDKFAMVKTHIADLDAIIASKEAENRRLAEQSVPVSEKTQETIETIKTLAKSIGMTFTPDPEKVAVFDKPTPTSDKPPQNKIK